MGHQILTQLLAVLCGDGAAVDDAEALGGALAELVRGPLADGSVHLLRLLGGGHLAGADSPDGLVSDDDLAAVGAPTCQLSNAVQQKDQK